MNDLTRDNQCNSEAGIVSSRRQFLKNFACGSLMLIGATTSATALARTHHVLRRATVHNHKPLQPQIKKSYKELALINPNTGESLRRVYYQDGQLITEALQEFNYLLRDYHTQAVHTIDTNLLDQLHDLKHLLAINKPFEVVSAYRSPYTNATLRRQSHGVAKHSLHMEGRAIDIRVTGFPTQHIRNAALALAKGGIGYYPDTNFVHLDTGDHRTW